MLFPFFWVLGAWVALWADAPIRPRLEPEVAAALAASRRRYA